MEPELVVASHTRVQKLNTTVLTNTPFLSGCTTVCLLCYLAWWHESVWQVLHRLPNSIVTKFLWVAFGESIEQEHETLDLAAF